MTLLKQTEKIKWNSQYLTPRVNFQIHHRGNLVKKEINRRYKAKKIIRVRQTNLEKIREKEKIIFSLIKVFIKHQVSLKQVQKIIYKEV